MSFLILDVDDNQAQAAVIYNSRIVSIANELGEDIFYGKKLLTEKNAFLGILSEIIALSEKITYRPVDAICVVHQPDLAPASFGLVQEVCESLKISTLRFMTRALAQMVYLFTYEPVYKQAPGNYILFHAQGGQTECLALNYEDEVIEVLFNENLKHMAKVYECVKAFEDKPRKIVLSGDIPKTLSLKVQKLCQETGSLLASTAGNQTLTGAASYASKLMGYQCDLLVLDMINQDLGLVLKENSFARLFGKENAIPIKNVLKITREEIKDNRLVFLLGSLSRGFSSYELALEEFGPADWYEVRLGVDAARKMVLTVIASNGRYLETDLYREYFHQNKLTKKEVAFDESREMKLIEAIDNLKRSITYADQTGNHNISVGLEMVKKQMDDYLKNFGITEIKAVGQPFDVKYHNAVEHFDDPSMGENLIVSEYKTGYMKDGKVLRYSEVVVVN